MLKLGQGIVETLPPRKEAGHRRPSEFRLTAQVDSLNHQKAKVVRPGRRKRAMAGIHRDCHVFSTTMQLRHAYRDDDSCEYIVQFVRSTRIKNTRNTH